MIKIERLVYNPFQLNTYFLFDETNECVIIDPGCMGNEEEQHLKNFITTNGLKPVHLLNTHCHVDHIMGNRFVQETYNLKLEANKKDQYNIQGADQSAQVYGLPMPKSPNIEVFLEEGDQVTFGNSSLDIIFTPGHTAGHICFYSIDDKILVCGDVLFNQSIGRTDLPGGDYETLISSIKNKVLPLGDDLTAYPGHGPDTTLGFEKENNPFLT